MLQKKWIRILLLSLPVLLIAGCIFLRDLALYIAQNKLPPCVSYSNFGIYCPGCGLTRCILALMAGDIWLAIRCNAVIFCLFTAIALIYAEFLLLSFGKDVHLLPRKAWFWILFAVCSAVYIVLRNFIPALAPPPLY